mmetsp:Transcript_24577/g.80280  ORF Transcript_24577/g.80280 Transcript_24577/m.80280 type:complete len:232 (+) Transcript_24577:4788-5483(+)
MRLSLVHARRSLRPVCVQHKPLRLAWASHLPHMNKAVVRDSHSLCVPILQEPCSLDLELCIAEGGCVEIAFENADEDELRVLPQILSDVPIFVRAVDDVPGDEEAVGNDGTDEAIEVCRLTHEPRRDAWVVVGRRHIRRHRSRPQAIILVRGSGRHLRRERCEDVVLGREGCDPGSYAGVPPEQSRERVRSAARQSAAHHEREHAIRHHRCLQPKLPILDPCLYHCLDLCL